jgi:hypothetical protein
MPSLRGYEKTFRISTPNYRVPGKLTLSDSELRDLLKGTLEITEKVDGANTAILRGVGDDWSLQKRRGIATQQHPQFSFFWSWARANEEKIHRIAEGWTVYGELTYAKHNIYYDALPSYFLVFDVWTGNEYLDTNDRLDLCSELNFQHVPMLFYGRLEGDEHEQLHQLENFIGPSKVSTTVTMEGIVVKNAIKQMRGKLVRPEFMKQLEEDDHWLYKKLVKNQLAPGIDPYK